MLDVGKREDDYDGVIKLLGDLITFSLSNSFPTELPVYVPELKDADILFWYKQLLLAYEATKPQTPVDATMFVSETLTKSYIYGVEISKLEGFLKYYGLPPFYTMQRKPLDEALILKEEVEARHKFLLVLQTLPVTRDQVADGGCLTVYVEIQEYFYLPSDLLFLMTAYNKAWANRDDSRARELLNEINATEEYKFMCIDGLDTLTKKYEIRLRGVVVPGIETSRGIEARDELVKMVNGERLRIEVSHLDDNHRCVGDVYCNGFCLQDKLLAKGLATRDHVSGMEL